MEKKEVAIGTPVSVAGVTLIPIIMSSLGHRQGRRAISFWGIKQPLSVLAISPSGRVAFSMTGDEVPLDQLAKEVPALKTLLEQ